MDGQAVDPYTGMNTQTQQEQQQHHFPGHNILIGDSYTSGFPHSKTPQMRQEQQWQNLLGNNTLLSDCHSTRTTISEQELDLVGKVAIIALLRRHERIGEYDKIMGCWASCMVPRSDGQYGIGGFKNYVQRPKAGCYPGHC
ncbi:hypothetical protein T440DRAFT_464219 [Plenodomus tracheiphilus IPT5]|uniref:Uncharacterized protein n=1 Tax=Plenodomus tracheiphilus IPT5 TaxID=1408161 RepID=A0A6A7BNZ2_9PLEO|nr:hypothetical protein T440DRAFT_464219 [Plenodomus tracheiphilus IPT5]